MNVFDMFSKGRMGLLISVYQRYVLGTVIILPKFRIALIFLRNVFVSLLAKVTVNVAIQFNLHMIYDAAINITRLL